MDTLPVQYVVAFAIKLEIGSINKVINGKQSSALATDEERLRSTVVYMLGYCKKRVRFVSCVLNNLNFSKCVQRVFSGLPEFKAYVLVI